MQFLRLIRSDGLRKHDYGTVNVSRMEVLAKVSLSQANGHDQTEINPEK